MAEDVQSTIHGPNGERVQVQVGSKSLAVTTRDLVTVLLILLVGGLGYYRTITLDDSLKAMDGHLQALYKRQDDIRDYLHTQDTLLAVQTQELRQELHQQNSLLAAQTEAWRTWLVRHDWNMGKEPQDRLPLDVPLPPPRGQP